MIIEWKKNNINYIECFNPVGIKTGSITLLPGQNEVEDELWKGARVHVQDDIDRGNIIEKFAKVEIKKEIDPETKKEKIEVKIENSKDFHNLSLQDQIEVVKDTYNIKTLKEWKKKSAKDSVISEINNQIEMIEEHGEEKTKNKNDNEEN